MNYCKEIFKLLDLQPYEEFQIKKNTGEVFRLTEDLMLEHAYVSTKNWRMSTIFNVLSILRGKAEIIKEAASIEFSTLTEKEQLALNYAKNCGMNWIVKTQDNFIFAFSDKPVRGERTWFKRHASDKAIEINIPLSFLEWESSPYYINL
jgi:hypothetical protein